MGNDLPPPDRARTLCSKPLTSTLGLQRKDYWEEVTPLLVGGDCLSMNDSKCPNCDRVIRVNMARHLRLCHTTYVCFWRCRVSTCPLWFTSELNGKDHIVKAADAGVSENMDWSGLAAGHSLTNVKKPHKHCGWTLPWLAVPARSSTTPTILPRAWSSHHSGDLS